MHSVIDLIIRIKNSYMSKKPKAIAKFSKVNQAVLEVLAKEGFVKSFDVLTEGSKKTFDITLSYADGKSKFTDLEIVSKPGQKRYVEKSDIPYVLNGLGAVVLSTNKGIMTGKDAKKLKVGGEMLFKIW